MTRSNEMKRAARTAAGDMQHAVSDGHLTRTLYQHHQQLLTELREQRDDVGRLRRELRGQRPGGFPWGLVLMAGAAYALYRNNPTVRDRIGGLLGRLDPGIQGNLARAGDAVKDAANDLVEGRSPTDAFKRGAGEVQRAGEKAVDSARDAWDNVKDDARQAAEGVKAQVNRGNA